MPYTVRVRRRPRRTMVQLPPDDYRRVRAALAALAEEPRPVGVAKVRGNELWRIRVGDYRVVYYINDQSQEVVVVRAEHRSTAYRDL
ncbi:MAG: type II toxin-antitoxin system RelE/ParE family toxin [Chloroflexi bacterium]|nr:type II toxin-antitoxin system RelE/ParE family toxin [Chloroflexota bacterium]